MAGYVELFIKGIVIGFSIAAPVGPIGVLCIRRTLSYGILVGLMSGLGAAVADAVYGLVAGFGLSSVSNLLLQYQFFLQLVGGLFLAYLGITTFLSSPAKEAAKVEGHGLLGAFLSTFFLTITNPMTILAFAAILSGVGVINAAGDYGAATALVGGVFVGSATWFFFLSCMVGLLRSKVNYTVLAWINKISGVIILAFAVYILAQALFS